MQKTIEHKRIVEIKPSKEDLEKYYSDANSLDIMFGQVHEVYGNEKGELPSDDFLNKYKDYSIWNIDNRPVALETKYQKMDLDALEKEQSYLILLTAIINKQAKEKWKTKKKDGGRYFKGLKLELKNGEIDGQKVTDGDLDRTYYVSSKVLEQALNPSVKILSKLIGEREKEKDKSKEKPEEKEQKKDEPKEEPIRKPEEPKPDDKPKEEKERVDVREKLKQLEDVVKTFKDQESQILEKRYGRGVLGKFHKWLETTHAGKATKIATKILGGVAAASLATATTGGVGLVLAPILYAGGARYAIGGAIEGLQYLIGGWKRNHLLSMQSATMNSLITQKEYIFKLDDKNKYVDHIKELTAKILEQEKNVLNVWLSNIAKEKRDKAIRAVLATVATGAFAWIYGIPYGLQDFNKDGLYHSVIANNEGFSFIYRAADNVDRIRENLTIRDLGFWGIGHTLGNIHGIPYTGYIGLGTAAAGIAIKLARDVKQRYGDIFATGYKPSEIKPVDFSKAIVEIKEDTKAQKTTAPEEKKIEKFDKEEEKEETTDEDKTIQVTPENYSSIYPELEEFVVEANEKINKKYKTPKEKKEALEKIASNLEIYVNKKIKEFEDKFQEETNFNQNKEDFVDFKKDLNRAFDCFVELNYDAFIKRLKESNPLAGSFFEMGAKRFSEHVRQPK